MHYFTEQGRLLLLYTAHPCSADFVKAWRRLAWPCAMLAGHEQGSPGSAQFMVHVKLQAQHTSNELTATDAASYDTKPAHQHTCRIWLARGLNCRWKVSRARSSSSAAAGAPSTALSQNPAEASSSGPKPQRGARPGTLPQSAVSRARKGSHRASVPQMRAWLMTVQCVVRMATWGSSSSSSSSSGV